MFAKVSNRHGKTAKPIGATMFGRLPRGGFGLAILWLTSVLALDSSAGLSLCQAQETGQQQTVKQEGEKKEGDVNQDDPQTKARLATEQLICDSIKALDVSLRDEDEAVRIDAYRRLLPNQELMAKLFGETNGKKLWEGMEPALKKMLTMTERSKEATVAMGALLDVKVRNCREQDAEVQGYDEVLKMIPADVAVYNAAIQFEQGVVVAGSYVVVDNKVHWLRGLEQYPKILKATK